MNIDAVRIGRVVFVTVPVVNVVKTTAIDAAVDS